MIAREVLIMSDGVPTCVEIIVGESEPAILKVAQERHGEKAYLFPCRLDATLEEANTPHSNKRMVGYGGWGI